MTAGHLAQLPGTGWQVWRHAILRSAGFPVAGLDLLADPALAAVADAFLDGLADASTLDKAHDDAGQRLAEAARQVAADERFRSALLWQNPSALTTVDSLLRDTGAAARNARNRRREDLIARYWQRYCAKNDTVGFFGPMYWARLDPDLTAPVDGGPGPRLVRSRYVHFEWWALDALGRRLATDPRVRPWLPVTVQPQLTVRGRQVLFTDRDPLEVAAPVAALLAACAGTRRAADIATELTTGPDAPFRRDADVYAQLTELVGRGVLRWAFDLPMNLSAERVLRDALSAIGDPPVREQALAALDRLCAARDATAAAETPEELATAMQALAATFEELTGESAHHRPGETYAGRTLCHLDATRDVDLRLGRAVIDALAPLAPLLDSARWLTGAIAGVVRGPLEELYHDLSAEAGGGDVPFGQLWFLAQATIGGATGPVGAVVDDYLRRWSGVLGLADQPPGTRRLDLTTADLAARVAHAFGDGAPGWRGARLHSPDVHVCAPDRAALERGEFRLVLGEVHIGWAAFDSNFFALGHPDPTALTDAIQADIPASRVRLLLPPEFPRNTARNAEWLHRDDDVQLGFAPAPGADPDRLVPVTALTVRPGGSGRPEVCAPDGRSWPLIEPFADLLGLHAFDTWKLTGGHRHTPRVSVDGMVLVRETWRCTVGETGLAGVTGERERYLAARRWRREVGLPERVFVRIATELKPCYVDFTSLAYTRMFCTLVRSARDKAGDGVELDITEMLPTGDDAWLTDAEGRRYTSELRLQLRDPQVAD